MILRIGHGLMTADVIERATLREERVAVMTNDNPFHGQPVQVINYMGPLLSDLLHEMAEDSPSGIAAAYVIKAGLVHWSLRSTSNGPNVAAIAALWGGGGHAHAAGFRCSLREFQTEFFRFLLVSAQ